MQPHAHVRVGTRAQQPAANTVALNVLYIVTDEGNKWERSTGSAWASVTPTGVALALGDGDKGDIVVSSSGGTWTIDTGVVTTTKMGGDVTAAGKALLDDANAGAQRTTLGLGTMATQNAASVAITGGSISGASVAATTLTSTSAPTFGTGSGAMSANIDGGAGTTRSLNIRTGGSLRWGVAGTQVAEPGSNAGTGFAINAYSDGGTFIDAPVSIVRAAGGAITFNRPLTANFALDMGANKISNVAPGAATGEVATYEQLGTVPPIASGNMNTAGADTPVAIPAGSWRVLELVITDWTCAADFAPFLRCNADATAGIYRYSSMFVNASTGGIDFGYGGTVPTGVNLFDSGRMVEATSNRFSTVITLLEPSGTAHFKTMTWLAPLTISHNDGEYRDSKGSGIYGSNSALTSLTLFARSTTQQTGTAGSAVNATGGRWALFGRT